MSVVHTSHHDRRELVSMAMHKGDSSRRRASSRHRKLREDYFYRSDSGRSSTTDYSSAASDCHMRDYMYREYSHYPEGSTGSTAPATPHNSDRRIVFSKLRLGEGGNNGMNEHFQKTSFRMGLRVSSAQNLPKVRRFGRNNPFAVITCGSLTQVTRVHKKGGQNPEWNQEFTFKIGMALRCIFTYQCRPAGMHM